MRARDGEHLLLAAGKLAAHVAPALRGAGKQIEKALRCPDCRSSDGKRGLGGATGTDGANQPGAAAGAAHERTQVFVNTQIAEDLAPLGNEADTPLRDAVRRQARDR